MVLRAYSIGMMLSFIVIATGALIYTKTNKVETTGAKLMLYGSLIMAVLVWPIGLPTALALFGKAIIGKITGIIFKDTEKAIEEVHDK